MRAHTQPLAIVAGGTDGELCQALEPVALDHGDGGFREDWLQGLIDRHPGVLPIAEIEPGLAEAVAVCRELPVSSGYVDHLLVTPEGGIVLVETKLWRNPEARRAVIGQILDYASDLAELDYEDLEGLVVQARKAKGQSLYRLVCPDGSEAGEAAFIDAVSRNLRLGRLLLLLVGDGIREGVEKLADYLQRHVGLHFTLGLIELSLWRNPRDGTLLVQPRILAHTVQIERAVVRLEGDVSRIPAKIIAATPQVASRRSSLTRETFMEELAAEDATLPAKLTAFLDAVAPLGIQADQQASLLLRWQHPDGTLFHLGGISRHGEFLSAYTQWSAAKINRFDLSEAYQEALAKLIPGAKLTQTEKRTGWWIAGPDGLNPPVAPLLAKAPQWISAIRSYIDALLIATGEESPPATARRR